MQQNAGDLMSRCVKALFKPRALMSIVVSWRNFMSSITSDSTGCKNQHRPLNATRWLQQASSCNYKLAYLLC